MSHLETALKTYREDGFTHVLKVLRNRILSWWSTVLALILPAQTESQRTKDAAQFWSQCENSGQIREYSHWVGEGIFENSDKWAGVGETHFQMWKQFTTICREEQANKRMREWGSGGGANAIVFAKVFENFFGVEISAASLNECEKQLETRGIKGFTPMLINTESPEEVINRIDEPFDFFMAAGVFHHFPSKAYGARVLSVANAILRPGAFALIQIRYDDLRPKYKPKSRDYKTHAIHFTSYKLDEFWKLASDKGFTPRYIELQPSVNFAYFYLIKEKDLNG